VTEFQQNIQHGDRVLVYDSRDFINDKVTPVSMLMRPATVVCRYGCKTRYSGMDEDCVYPDLVDVLFDHRPERISHGHFTEGVDPVG